MQDLVNGPNHTMVGQRQQAYHCYGITDVAASPFTVPAFTDGMMTMGPLKRYTQDNTGLSIPNARHDQTSRAITARQTEWFTISKHNSNN